MRKFIVGDICRVRQWEDMEKEFGLNTRGDIKCKFTFTKEMRDLCGRLFTIKKIQLGHYNSEEEIEMDNAYGGFIYNRNISEDMLEYSAPEDGEEYTGEDLDITDLIGG